jgi:hypothetical protein
MILNMGGNMTNSLRIRWPALLVVITFAALWVRHSRADAPLTQYLILSGTAYDTKSQLTWERYPSLYIYSWEEAQTHCRDLDLDGSGWRVPSVKELQTLVDEGRTEPSVDSFAFPVTANAKYWTSTVRASDKSRGWLVSFSFGSTSTDDISHFYRVRCVR